MLYIYCFYIYIVFIFIVYIYIYIYIYILFMYFSIHLPAMILSSPYYPPLLIFPLLIFPLLYPPSLLFSPTDPRLDDFSNNLSGLLSVLDSCLRAKVLGNPLLLRLLLIQIYLIHTTTNTVEPSSTDPCRPVSTLVHRMAMTSTLEMIK